MSAASITGRDFFFRVSNLTGKSDVRHVRLYGSSERYLESIRPQYAKEGFLVSASTQDEYRAANWSERKAA